MKKLALVVVLATPCLASGQSLSEGSGSGRGDLHLFESDRPIISCSIPEMEGGITWAVVQENEDFFLERRQVTEPTGEPFPRMKIPRPVYFLNTVHFFLGMRDGHMLLFTARGDAQHKSYSLIDFASSQDSQFNMGAPSGDYVCTFQSPIRTSPTGLFPPVIETDVLR